MGNQDNKNLPTTITPGSALSLAGANRGRLTKAERRASQAIQSTRQAGQVVKAQEAVKIEVISDVTQSALLAASDISSLEGVLAARTPHAVGRLSFIADSGAQALGHLVNQVGRQL